MYNKCYELVIAIPVSSNRSVLPLTRKQGTQYKYRGTDKSLARPGRKQAQKHVRDVHDFNNIETRAVTKFFFFFLQGKVPKEIHAILKKNWLVSFPGRAKDLSVPLYNVILRRVRGKHSCGGKTVRINYSEC